MKLYVGNLPFTAKDQDVIDHFSSCGKVVNVAIINDRETGKPRGFGFVEMQDATSAQKAIDTLDGQPMGGRNLKINQAQERPRPQAR